MEDFAMFDEVACEEFYNEDWARWMDEMEMETVNAELQVIADEERLEEISDEWAEMMMARYWSSPLEASHVEA
jgi:hypothetical protein